MGLCPVQQRSCFNITLLSYQNPTHISISQKKINCLQLAVFELDEVIYESLCAPNTDCIVMDWGISHS